MGTLSSTLVMIKLFYYIILLYFPSPCWTDAFFTSVFYSLRLCLKRAWNSRKWSKKAHTTVIHKLNDTLYEHQDVR